MAPASGLKVHDDCTACAVTDLPSFCNLLSPSLAALNEVKFTAVYPKGSMLFVEGEMPRGVFLLCSGRAKVTTSSSEGKTLIVRIATAGEILGVSAIVSGEPYEVSVETIEPSQLSFIKREDFLRLLNSSPELCLNAVRQLSGKYHDAQREIRLLGLSHSTTERMAHLLLDWCVAGGTAADGGTRLRVLFTHEDMAQMIGSTRETVTRVMADFKHDDLIEVKGASVLVRNRSALESMITT